VQSNLAWFDDENPKTQLNRKLAPGEIAKPGIFELTPNQLSQGVTVTDKNG
jgi:hypothetical protein